MDRQTILQEDQYTFPYHHLVDFDKYTISKTMVSGMEYFGYIDFVMGLLNKYPFNSLLDVGCGDGKMLFELAKKNQDKKFIGIDRSDKAIAFARAFGHGTNVSFYQRDITEEKETYDIITLIETLEHVPEEHISQFVYALSERLNKNGKLIVSVPTTNFPTSKKHYRHYTRELLQKHLSSFEIKETFYLVKQGILRDWLTKLSYKFPNFNVIQRFSFYIANKMLYTANESTGRHLVCVLTKTKPLNA